MFSRFGNKSAITKVFSNPHLCYIPIVQTSSRAAPDAVFIEKTSEDPVIILAEEDDVDLIGPPDPVSNLRPIVRKQVLNETNLQKQLRLFQDETQSWNHQFWSQHNQRFIKEREEYIKEQQKLRGDSQNLTADEMSEFYKSFLDKNWQTHVRYNFEWYKKNFRLLYLAFLVGLQKNTRFS